MHIAVDNYLSMFVIYGSGGLSNDYCDLDMIEVFLKNMPCH